MQLFYNPEVKTSDKEIHFSKDESRHIFKVLRKSAGDLIHITNGEGNVFEAELSQVSQKHCVSKILKFENESPLPYRLHLAVAPTKLNDRYEWFLEKATEIGITEITPIICEYSERKVVKMDRCNRIVQSALKQSLKAWMPKIHTPLSYEDFIASKSDYDIKCIAHCEETEKQSLKDVVLKGQSACILIGPEGDFSTQEIKAAMAAGYCAIHLGQSRLRTETAAIVACHSVAFINEN